MSEKIADELYELRDNKYSSFIELLKDVNKFTSADSRKLEILIKLDFFEEFGSISYLLKCVEIFDSLYCKKQYSKKKAFEQQLDFDLLRQCCGKETDKTFFTIRQ